MRISRRAVVAGAVAAPLLGGVARAATAVSVSLDPASRLGALPADFMGLGYEISSVSADGVLSAKNRSYVKLVRNLGRQGVIRVGGNTSDFSRYDAKAAPVSAQDQCGECGQSARTARLSGCHQMETHL